MQGSKSVPCKRPNENNVYTYLKTRSQNSQHWVAVSNTEGQQSFDWRWDIQTRQQQTKDVLWMTFWWEHEICQKIKWKQLLGMNKRKFRWTKVSRKKQNQPLLSCWDVEVSSFDSSCSSPELLLSELTAKFNLIHWILKIVTNVNDPFNLRRKEWLVVRVWAHTHKSIIRLALTFCLSYTNPGVKLRPHIFAAANGWHFRTFFQVHVDRHILHNVQQMLTEVAGRESADDFHELQNEMNR